MRIAIPQAVEDIIGRLRDHGFEAFAVGGCVRDSLLGREPGDWDITTSASPYQVKEIFHRTIDTGIQHGTVTIMQNHIGYEVTTYRIDGEYVDGRHPKTVEFTSELKEDLCRRDFTINAMAYSHETGIVDIFGGAEDLRAGVIRCVGKPEDRFREDALRILRAIRFSAQLGFSIEEQTKAAIRSIAPNLARVSKERIQTELTKLLLSAHPEIIREVYTMGVSPYISPAFHQIFCRMFHSVDCSRSRFSIPSELPPQKHIRWAVCLNDGSQEEAVQVLKELKLDNATISRVSTLHPWISRTILADKVEIRRAISQMGPELFDDLLVIKEALASKMAKEVPAKKMTEEAPEQEQVSGQEQIKQIKKLTREIHKSDDCTCLKDLAVTGKDLLAHGMKPGKQVGETLSRLLDYVLVHPEANQKELLLNMSDFIYS